MNEDIFVGIDIGGTSVKIGLIKDCGVILKEWEVDTNKQYSGEQLLTSIWDSVNLEKQQLNIHKQQIKAIGVGSAGFIDAQLGIVREAVNIGWRDFYLGDYLRNISNLPVFVENDANIAALGELWQGAGKGEENIITVTLGTGVGGGVIVDGKVISGTNGTAGEIGHIIVEREGAPCNCGRRGCLETIVSATGIVRLAMDKIQKNPDSQLALFYQREGSISAKDIFSFAKNKDEHSLDIVDQIGDVLGLAIANLGVVVNPAKVLIGGGVSKAGSQLIDAIERGFNQYALRRVKEVCDIGIAKLENKAGIIGAAYLAKTKTN